MPVAMPPKGGVRKRLRVDSPDDAPSSDVAASSTGLPSSSTNDNPRSRGVRHRLGVANTPPVVASASSSGLLGRASVRHHNLPAETPEVSPDVPPAFPLNKSMRKMFAKGRLSAVEIEEIFRGAADQGAAGTPTLSSPNHPQNLQRSLLSAFGQPVGAPSIAWRTIPTTKGMAAHPFLLPHVFLLHCTQRSQLSGTEWSVGP